MKLIAHRGNINGPNKEKENHPDHINDALKIGYDVEIDIWHVNCKWYLGHDEPKYEVTDYSFLQKDGLWIHAKNGDAFYKLIQNTDGIIKDIFTTFILSSSIKNKPIFKNFVGNMSSSEADVSEDSAIDTHMQKIFDSNVFEDGIENAIIVDYLNKNVSIIES